MITHMVLLQPKTQTSSEEMAQALEHVQTLRESIAGMIDVQVGANSSLNHQGYTYGFVMHFVDREHFQAYAPHPAHRIVSEELVRLCERIIDVDLETPEER